MADQPAGVGHGQDNSACQWDRYGGVGSTIVQIRDESVTPGEGRLRDGSNPRPATCVAVRSNPYWYSSDMTEVLTYLERLREVALDQHGFVTTAQAVADGIPKTELPKLASRGRIERVAHGVYRIPQVPTTPHDNWALAVLWTGVAEACLSHETALAAWDVSDVNPDRVHLTVGKHRRLRRAGGERYVIHQRDVDPGLRTWWEGIPITNLPTTIADCIDTGTPSYLIRQAIEIGGRTSLLPASDRDRLIRLLEERDGRA